MMRKRFLVAGAVAAVVLSVLAGSHLLSASDKEDVDPAAVERTRKTVRMLDDVYKTTIVLITDKYVHDKKDYPAGRAAVVLFKKISDKGWHEVRIIDASGQPYSDHNTAKDQFEKDGIKELKNGKAYYEKVEHKDGKPYLRAITPIPVVMDKCITCHENYKQAKEGEPIGALTYTIPIE